MRSNVHSSARARLVAQVTSSSILILLLAVALPSAASVVALESPAPAALAMSGFELRTATTVAVSAQGLRYDSQQHAGEWFVQLGETLFGSESANDNRGCYAWILDANTRETVWELDLEDADRGDARNHRRADVELELPAGRYEVYLYGGHALLEYRARQSDPPPAVAEEFDAVREELRQCFVRVDASGAATFTPTGRFDDALIAMNGLGDGEFRRQAFELTRDSELRLYGMLEYSRGADDPADFGWIVDLDSGRRVWDMSNRRGRHAGGAVKNRLLDRKIRLDAGRYLLVYGTDDSHSVSGFNAAPPRDPLAWGVQLLPGPGFERGSFRVIETPERPKPVIDFSGVRDAEFFEQPFRLDRPAQLHILALGESTDGGWTWADHGWILEAKTRELVWEMDGRNTEPAGGDAKNRMFEDVVPLAAGEYVALYSSDGSHSFEEWNAAAPFEPQAWGMQIAVEPSRAIELLDKEELAAREGVLADLTRVRDHEERSERFTLDRPTKVEIRAVGEGLRGEMFDYGLLRSVSGGRTVWEMDYDDTEHAGGDEKNRATRVELELAPGEYEAVYETDGSHAFGDWNSAAPRDPLSWGMTVRVVR